MCGKMAENGRIHGPKWAMCGKNVRKWANKWPKMGEKMGDLWKNGQKL
jgi:hypothetical protein